MHTPRTLCIVLALLVSTAGVAVAENDTVIDHAGDGPVFVADENQTVNGTTPFEEGRIVSIRITSLGPTHPFLMSKAIAVGENGSFDVTFDLSELALLRGGPVEVVVRRNDTRVHAIEGTLVTQNMPNGSTLTPYPAADDSTTTTTTTTTATDAVPATGIDVPGLGLAAGVVALAAAALLARP